jgi:putative ABC transport system permease protein
MLRDLHETVRLLWRNRGLSAFAILILGGGIGASTAVFALVYGVLLDRLPFTEPDRLVWMYNLRTERDRAPLSIPDLQDYQRGATTIEAFAPFTNWTANLTGAGEAERLEGTRVSGNFFEVLGTRAAVGRTLQPQDAVSPRTVVLTDRLWNRRFARDPAVVGRPLTLNGVAYTVVGVLPRNFVFPFRQADVAVGLPLGDDPRRGDRGANFLRVVARLRAGATVGQAKADLDRIAGRLQRDYPADDARKVGVSLYPLHAEIVRDYRQILWTLFVVVGVLLAIGAGNLANLLLIRGLKRKTELTVRLALGATRARVVSLLMAEGALLALAGGITGLALAAAALPLWRRVAPVDFPRLPDLSLQGPVIAFACLVSIAVGLLASAIPAWGASRDIRAGAGASGRVTEGRRQGTTRRAFVMLQIAGSTALLICMATAGRALATLEAYDPGFRADGALSIQLSLPSARYSDRAAIARFHDDLQRRFSALPGSPVAGSVSLLPLSGLLSTVDVAFPDKPAPPPDQVPQAHLRVAGPQYFKAAGIDLLAGREFSDADRDHSRPVAIVSDTFARRHWPGASAIGRHLSLAPPPPGAPIEVVGVVTDVKQFGIDGAATADLYLPIHQMPAFQTAGMTSRMYWVIRESGRGVAASDVRKTIYGLDPEIAASSVQSLSQLLASTMAPTRAHVLLVDVFGYVALFLAMLGVYGATSYAAGARRRDLAIRAAFGAGRRDLRLSMLRHELWPITFGLSAGLAVSYLALPAVLSSVSAAIPREPFVFLYTSVGMLTVSIAAGYVAAVRAGWAEPAELLRG